MPITVLFIAEILIVLFIVEITYGRDLRDIAELREPEQNPGLLLSALCIEDGQLRKACLEGKINNFK